MAGSISFHKLQLIVQSYKTLVPGTLDASRGINKDWGHCQPPHENFISFFWVGENRDFLRGDFFSIGWSYPPPKEFKTFLGLIKTFNVKIFLPFYTFLYPMENCSIIWKKWLYFFAIYNLLYGIHILTSSLGKIESRKKTRMTTSIKTKLK